MFLAFLVITIGIFYLLKAMGIISEDIWSFIWPSILIVLGLSMIFKQKRRRSFWWDMGDWHEFGQRMQQRFKKED